MFVIGTTHFYRGPERPENELLGIVYCCSSPNLSKIRLSHEHTECRWVDRAGAKELLSESDLAERWLLKVIERADTGRRLMPAELIDLHRLEGFGLDS